MENENMAMEQQNEGQAVEVKSNRPTVGGIAKIALIGVGAVCTLKWAYGKITGKSKKKKELKEGRDYVDRAEEQDVDVDRATMENVSESD